MQKPLVKKKMKRQGKTINNNKYSIGIIKMEKKNERERITTIKTRDK